MKKLLLLTSLFLLLGLCMSVHADEVSQVDIGYYDCWLHSDGETWQNGIKPGSIVNHTPTITSNVADISKITGVKSVEFYPNDDIGEDYYSYAVSGGVVEEFEYLGNGQVTFSFNTVLVDNSGEGGLSQKKWWQATQVQGKRFYLPVKIVWEVESEPSTLHVRHFLVDPAGGGSGLLGELTKPIKTDLNVGDEIIAEHKIYEEFSESEILSMTIIDSGQQEYLQYLKNNMIPSGHIVATSSNNDFDINLNNRKGNKGEEISVKATYNGGTGERENVLLLFCYEIDQSISGNGYIDLDVEGSPNPVELNPITKKGEFTLDIKATVHDMPDGETIEYWIVRHMWSGSNWVEERIDSSNTSISKSYTKNISKDTTYNVSVSAYTDSDIVISTFNITPSWE